MSGIHFPVNSLKALGNKEEELVSKKKNIIVILV